MTWNWQNLKSGYQFEGDLDLTWEVMGDPMSDDYTPEEVDAQSLLKEWLDKYYPDGSGEQLYGPGAVRISWFIGGDAMERAPFLPTKYFEDEESFITFFTWPEDAVTGERLNFNSLPVLDKMWRPGKSHTKGGFIQEATGWKPSALQPAMHVPTVLHAAGLHHLVALNQVVRNP